MAATKTSPLVQKVRVLFGKHLFATNVVSCGVLMGLGDAAVQRIEMAQAKDSEAKTAQWDRTGRITTMGFAMGPMNHVWYTMLDAILPGKAASVVVKKILMDQTIAAPFFAFTYFMGSGTLERQPLDVSWTDFKAKFWTVYKADWTVWPAAQAVNFLLVPPQFRVIYVAMVTFGWNTFLSYVKHKEIDSDPASIVTSDSNKTTTHLQLAVPLNAAEV